MQRLGNAIRAAREAAGLKQRQLAAKLDVDPRTVRNWENGKTVPLSHLGALEHVLGVRLRDEHGRPLGCPDAPPIDSQVPRLPEWLRQRMAELGIESIRGLARRVDVAVETARQILAGNRVPHEDTLKKMSRTLLLPGEDSANLLLLLRRMSGLPPGEPAPYVPPKVADQLSAHSREVVDTIIHALAKAERINLTPEDD